MRITRDNYEAYLLDRSEGNLSAPLNHELEVFLLANPDLTVDIDSLPTIDFHTDLSAVEKDTLKKTLPPSGFELQQLDDLLIAKLEGDLAADQLAKLDALITKDEQVALAWRQIGATKSQPVAMSFPKKEKLKKGGVIIPLFRVAAIAASIALLFGALWIFSPTTNTNSVAGDTREEVKDSIAGETEKDTGEENQSVKKTEASFAEQSTAGEENETENAVKTSTGRAVERAKADPILAQTVLPKPAREALATLPTIRNVSRYAVPPADLRSAPITTSIPQPTVPHEPPTYTVSEYFASVVRSNVLDQSAENAGPLNSNDAVAMIDLGLDKIANGKAGLTHEKTDQRRRWALRLGRLNLEADLHN